MMVINTIFNLLVLPSSLPPPLPTLLFHYSLLLPLWHNFGFPSRRIISEVLDKHKKYTSAMSINCVLCWYLYVYKYWCGMEALRKFKVNLQEQILTFHHVGSFTHWTTSLCLQQCLKEYQHRMGAHCFREYLYYVLHQKHTLIWLQNWLISWLIG